MSARLIRASAKLDKAKEYRDIAQLVADSWYDGAVSNAVLAGINAADALMVLAAGDFEMYDQHEHAVKALRNNGFHIQAKQLAGLLALKNRSQYSADRCTPAQARDAMVRAERLVDGVEAMYNQEKGKE